MKKFVKWMGFLTVSLFFASPAFCLSNSEKFAAAKVVASQIVTKANAKSPGSLASQLQALLPQVTVSIPEDGHDFIACLSHPDMFSFVLPTSASTLQIWLCNLAMTTSVSSVAQTFIHEMIHIALNSRDECLVSTNEIDIMKQAGMKPYENGYVADCGLQSKGPFSN